MNYDLWDDVVMPVLPVLAPLALLVGGYLYWLDKHPCVRKEIQTVHYAVCLMSDRNGCTARGRYPSQEWVCVERKP